MVIQYQFNVNKAVATMATFVARIGAMDKLKLIKLLYFADRDCFIKYGHPITGDRQCAMDHGPVPSGCLNVLDGNIESELFSYLHLSDKNITPEKAPPPIQVLENDELDVIEETIRQYGDWSTSRLWKFVHDLPEYKETWVQGTSTTIPYERLLKHYGGEDRFRRGKPVITRAMRKYLVCPFPNSETI